MTRSPDNYIRAQAKADRATINLKMHNEKAPEKSGALLVGSQNPPYIFGSLHTLGIKAKHQPFPSLRFGSLTKKQEMKKGQTKQGLSQYLKVGPGVMLRMYSGLQLFKHFRLRLVLLPGVLLEHGMVNS